MKRILLIFFCVVLISTPVSLRAQSQEVQQLILDIEKLAQLKGILKDMYKGYEILKSGYNTVRDLSKGSFSIHKDFLDGLLQVSPAVKKYQRVADIISYQLQIAKDCKSAVKNFTQDGNFSAGEVEYITNVYARLLQESLHNLDALTTVITSGKLRMSDDERIGAIDRICNDVSDQYTFLRVFSANTKMLSYQRAKDKENIEISKLLNGIN